MLIRTALVLEDGVLKVSMKASLERELCSSKEAISENEWFT